MVDKFKNFIVTQLSTAARLIVAEVPELDTNGSIHDQDTSSTKKEGCCAQEPIGSYATVGIDPACALTGCKVVPCTRICEKRGGVEQVAEEGGCKEGRTEAGSRFADVILVELRETGAKVKDGRHPGQYLAGDFGSGGMMGGPWVGKRDTSRRGRWGKRTHVLSCCSIGEDGEEEGYVEEGLWRGRKHGRRGSGDASKILVLRGAGGRSTQEHLLGGAGRLGIVGYAESIHGVGAMGDATARTAGRMIVGT